MQHDAASLQAGGRVLMVSSLDEDHPGENVIDGSDRTYWISTGLYPQELLVQLCHPSKVSSLMVSTTHVRQLRIEACHEGEPINFQLLAEGDLGDGKGAMQVKELPCHDLERPVNFVRMMILSGWHDFCSVHRLQVRSDPHSPEERAAIAQAHGHGDWHEVSSSLDGNLAMQRRPSKVRVGRNSHAELNVEIPPHQLEHKDEPDAPRGVVDTWGNKHPPHSDDDPLSPRPGDKPQMF
jgi:heat shock protein beta-11